MIDLRSLELAGHRTWPAFHESWSGDWLVRATAGMSRRNNSVTPMGPAAVSTVEAVEWAEAWLIAHRVPPIFRMTDLAPDDLAALLEQRGYQRADTTLVMVREIGDALADPEVTVADRPGSQWLDVLVGSGARSPEHRETLRNLLGTSPSAGFAEVRMAGRVVAIGSTAVAGEHAAIFNMHTIPTYRRRGMATRILTTLLARAASLDAHTAMLQVREDNPEAIDLYKARGFEVAYRYWYYQR